MTEVASASAVATGVTSERLRNLRAWNLGLTVLHTAQAVLILVLAGSFAISITSTFPVGPPGAPPAAPEVLFDLRIGAVVAIFLALAAIDHLLTATLLRDTYERDLRRGINRCSAWPRSRPWPGRSSAVRCPTDFARGVAKPRAR